MRRIFPHSREGACYGITLTVTSPERSLSLPLPLWTTSFTSWSHVGHNKHIVGASLHTWAGIVVLCPKSGRALRNLCAACIKSSAAHRKYLVGLGCPRRKRAPTSPCWTAGARCCAAPRLSSSTCATARERGLPVKTSRDNDKRVEILVRKIPKESMHCGAQRRAHTYNTAFRLYVPCMYTLTFMTVSIHLQSIYRF